MRFQPVLEGRLPGYGPTFPVFGVLPHTCEDDFRLKSRPGPGLPGDLVRESVLDAPQGLDAR